MSIKLVLCSYNPVYAHFMVLKMKGFAMKNSKSAVFRRQQELLSLLKREKSIDVDTAAQELNVSPTTVRRDLNVFEKQHLVERFHGGARLLEGTLKEEDLPTTMRGKAQIDYDQKQAIARYAAGLIEDGDTIFMNSSSTTLMLLDYLNGKRVIIVTNNSNAIGYPHDPLVSIILTGGEIYQRRQSLVGEFALHTLTKINADKCFIGVGGISVRGGITTSVLPETAINEMMMRRCQGACYVLAATSKVGREHNFLSAPIDNISTLITCTGADEQEIQNLRDHHVQVIEVPYTAHTSDIESSIPKK